MPTSVIAVAIGYGASSAAAYFGASALMAAVAGGLASAAFNATFSSKPDQGEQQALRQDLSGTLITVRQPISSWQYIYGRTRVGGALTFVHESGDGNLHLVVTLAGHACHELGEVYFNDEALGTGAVDTVSNGKYSSNVRIRKSLGAEAGQPFPDLVAESEGKWTDGHRQSGRAKIYVRLTPNIDIFPTGIPNITVIIKGKEVYDPRSTLTAWSENASLCQADFICDTAAGLEAVYVDEIDEAQLIAAANIDDEAVTLAAGGTEARYTLNGSFLVNQSPGDVLGKMLTANAGKARYLGGKFVLQPAAYVAPAITFTSDDCRGVPHIIPRLSSAELCNGVKGIYVSEDNLWQPTDFPPVTNATYLAEDEGERAWLELTLTFTQSTATAQRIAKIELERRRQQITVEWKGKFNCYRVQPGNTAMLTFSMMGWTSKVFEVVQTSLVFEDDGAGGVRIGADHVLRETASSVFDWNSSEETIVDPAPDTNLPDPFDISAPVNVAAFSGNDELFLGGDGTIHSRVRLVWTASGAVFVNQNRGGVQIQFKPSADIEWQDAPSIAGDASESYVTGVEDGVAYDLRVRFENIYGVHSEWTQIAHTVVGKSGPPSDIERFVINGTQLAWDTVDDLDLAGYRVKFLPGTSRDWGLGIDLHQGLLTDSPYKMLIVPSGQVTFMIKAVDTSGNESENIAAIVTELGDALVANVVEIYDIRAAGFPGAMTACSVSGGNLVADIVAAPLMWNAVDAADMWSADSTTIWWDGSATQYAPMTYVDTFEVTEALSGSTLTIQSTIVGDPWSIEYRENSQRLLWSVDTSTGMWASDSSSFMWDQPAWLSWPGSIIVDNSWYDIRVKAGVSTVRGVVSELTLTVDAPDISEALNDVVIAAGGTRLSLVKTYAVIKNIQFTVEDDGGTAISARTYDKNVTLGPLVHCLDAAGSSTGGLVDAFIQGY